MVQIRTTYLETLERKQLIQGLTVTEGLAKSPTAKEAVRQVALSRLVTALTEKPTRPSRLSMMGAIRRANGIWAKVWVTPLTLRVPKPGTTVLNWTTARGKGSMEVDRRRVRLIVPETSSTTLKRATAIVASRLTEKVIDLTR